MNETFLFDKIIYGPVQSRRLGVSLGVNLLPDNTKVCSFDCIYCECGWTKNIEKGKLPKREQVKIELEKKLLQMQKIGKVPDVITFAGNGEPTMHKDFSGIIDDTIELCDVLCPTAKISVLSNSVHCDKEIVRIALLKVDNRILKLDSAIEQTMQLMNKPKQGVTVKDIMNNLLHFKGDFTLQTMFLKGEHNGVYIDNTSEIEIAEYINMLRVIKPKMVMIYTIDRNTPADNLEKIPLVQLEAIAERIRKVVKDVSVSG